MEEGGGNRLVAEAGAVDELGDRDRMPEVGALLEIRPGVDAGGIAVGALDEVPTGDEVGLEATFGVEDSPPGYTGLQAVIHPGQLNERRSKHG